MREVIAYHTRHLEIGIMQLRDLFSPGLDELLAVPGYTYGGAQGDCKAAVDDGENIENLEESSMYSTILCMKHTSR